MATTSASSPDMSITIKVVISGKDENRKFKLPLKDLGANTLPDKVRLTSPLAAFFWHVNSCTVVHVFASMMLDESKERNHADIGALISFVRCSAYLQVRQLSLSATLTALRLLLSSTLQYHLSTSSSTVQQRLSKS